MGFFSFSVTLEIRDQGNISFSFCLTTASYRCSRSAARAEDKALPPRWINRDRGCQAACLAVLSSACSAAQIRGVLLPRPHISQRGAGSGQARQSLPSLPAQPVVNHLLPNCCTLCPGGWLLRDVPKIFCRGRCRAFGRGSRERSCRAGTHVQPGCGSSLLPTAPLQSPSCCSSRQGGGVVFSFQMTQQCRLDAHPCPNPGCPRAAESPVLSLKRIRQHPRKRRTRDQGCVFL